MQLMGSIGAEIEIGSYAEVVNAGLGTRKKAKYLIIQYLAFSFA